MGRPKGSRNRPKADGGAPAKKKANGSARVEMTQHKNSEPLTDEQQYALIDQSARSYSKALAVKKDADAKLKAVCKAIKADGVKLTDVKTYLEAETEEGQAKIRERVEAAARIARWRCFPLGTQFMLFDDTTASHSYTLGKEAGLAGLKAAAPDNADINEWMRGWQEGQAILMGGFKETEPTTVISDNVSYVFDDQEGKII